jgi:enoyl-CoA hydratase
MSTTYELADGVATITLDDGKANALNVEMQRAIHEQLDRAEADDAVVVLTGRGTILSAGFDLKTPPEGWGEMVEGGARLAARLLDFPRPTIAACNGNAIAMGAFLLLSVDSRVGAGGDFKIGLNEVAIGMTVPWFGIELARHRLTKAAFQRCLTTGVVLGPDDARAAGFLDRVVDADPLAAALEEARALTGIDANAHRATKQRIRQEVLAAVRDGADRFGDGREW